MHFAMQHTHVTSRATATSAALPSAPGSAQLPGEQLVQSSTSFVDTRYLAAAATLLGQPKHLSYDAMHLMPGQCVLDVGCGPATDTIALAHVVGPTGQVVGVDADLTMLAEADRRSAAAGVHNRVIHVHADATCLPFQAETFDACRSERLLQYVCEPERVLAEMVRVTKADGWVVALDMDWGTLSIDSPEADIERRLARVCGEGIVANGYAGRTLYRLFREQQLHDIRVIPLALALTDCELARQLGKFDDVEAEALRTGAISLGELALWLNGLLEAEATGTFFASVTLMLVSGRKPRGPAGVMS